MPNTERPIFAFISTQGTAMSETALCAEHRLDGSLSKAADAARLAPDWNRGFMRDCTGNEALACIICGATTYAGPEGGLS